MASYPTAPECSLGNTPRAKGQVEEQLDHLANSASMIREMISRLESKLVPVIRDCPPVDCGKSSAEEYLVPVADQIRNTRRTLDACASDLDSLFNRIEL